MVMRIARCRAGESAYDMLVKCCLVAALCGAAVCPSGCGRGGKLAIAGKEPIKDIVKVENEPGALRAWTVNRARADVLIHIDPSDEMAVYPDKIMQDVKNAAGHLKAGNEKVIDIIYPWLQGGGTVNLGYMAGMYKRVIWIVPAAVPVGETSVDYYLSYLMTRRGLPGAALQNFKQDGLYITGLIAGVPMTITRLADLSLDKGTSAIINVNLAYFPEMKRENPSYRPGMSALLAFLRTIREMNVPTRIVTVDLATRSGIAGADIRFFGDVIAEALAHPNLLGGTLPEKWERMVEAEDSLVAKRYAGAAAIYSELAKGYPQDAGLHFSLAIAEGLAGRGNESLRGALNAYRLDREYVRGFMQLAKFLAANGQIAAGEAIVDAPELKSIFSPEDLEYEKGLFYYTARRPKQAIQYLMGAASRRQKDFGLLVIIYRTQKELGDVTGQLYTLQGLIELDEEKVRREAPWIYSDYGQLAEKIGYLGSANELYEKYVQVVPNDSLATVFKRKMADWKAKNLIKPRPKTKTTTLSGS